MDNNNMMNDNHDGQYDSNGQQDPNVQYGPYGQQDPGMQYSSYNQYYQQPYQPQDIYAKPGEGSGSDGWSIAAFVFGILAILTCCCYGISGIVFGIVAIVLACISKSQNGGRMPGLALAGLICGIVGAVLGLLYLGFIVLSILIDTGNF